jgi:glycosyltransferase involved in cell wall biosynthesis
MSSDDARHVTLVAHDVGGTGGMESHLTQIIEGLIERGLTVSVVSRSLRLRKRPGLIWHRVRGPARPFVIAYPWFFVVGSWVAARRGRGLLHTTGALVLNSADASTVHLCHRGFEAATQLRRTSRRGFLYRLNAAAATVLSRCAESFCYRPARTRHLVAVSSGVADELRRFYPSMGDRLSVIPNGVDRERFRPDPGNRAGVRQELGLRPDDLLLLFVGSEWSGKGLAHALEALGGSPGWHLAVLGEGDTDRYASYAAAVSAADRVHFLGRRTDPERHYAAADAFTLPSAYEAFPLVALEALSAGLPILASRVNGVTDVLVDGANGWFVNPDRADIAARLRELAADSQLRRRMGEESRRISERFEWRAAVDSHVELYASLNAARTQAL